MNEQQLADLAAQEAANAAYRAAAQRFLRGRIDETFLQAKQQVRRTLSQETLFTDWRCALEEWEMDAAELLRDELLLDAEKLLRSRMQSPERPSLFAQDEVFQAGAQALCAAFWAEKTEEFLSQERRLSARVAEQFDRYDRSILRAVRQMRQAAPLSDQIYYDGFLREAESLAQKPLPAGRPYRDYAALATEFALRVEAEEPQAQGALRALHSGVMDAVVEAMRQMSRGQ